MAPGAAGSRGTPAAAGGGGARCSSAASGCRWWPAGMRQCMQSTCAITIPCPSSWRAGDTGTQKAWGWRTLSELKSRCEVCQHLWSQRWDSEDGDLGATHSAKAMVPSLLPSCGSAGTAGDTGPGWGTSPCVAPVGTIGRPSSAGPVNAEMRGREDTASLRGSESCAAVGMWSWSPPPGFNHIQGSPSGGGPHSPGSHPALCPSEHP